MKYISCIIPAYNEEGRIGNVLEAVHRHPLINEVIVVDDGSKDQTCEIVGKFDNVKLIRHEKNKGKSQAVLSGIAKAKCETIFLLDADLLDLKPLNVTAIISPILSGEADITISLRKNAPWPFRKIGLDYISGERVFDKKLIAGHIKKIEQLPSYGFEVYLNKLIIKNRLKIKIVFWENVISPWKHQKGKFLAGLKGEVMMSLNILKTISVFEIIYQIVKMLALKI
ncbi:MAG: glycosyltransferase family 2 protein [Parcubacteria group bacterium]|jgi:glycosyltransferase involved in cell wall biosynthesis